jgi:uncharacterized protein with GYD domain
VKCPLTPIYWYEHGWEMPATPGGVRTIADPAEQAWAARQYDRFGARVQAVMLVLGVVAMVAMLAVEGFELIGHGILAVMTAAGVGAVHVDRVRNRRIVRRRAAEVPR